jgi:hypothetical protein
MAAIGARLAGLSVRSARHTMAKSPQKIFKRGSNISQNAFKSHHVHERHVNLIGLAGYAQEALKELDHNKLRKYFPGSSSSRIEDDYHSGSKRYG